MPAFTNEQLQLTIAQLDQAISSHDLWYKQLMRVLVSRQPPEQADLALDAHLQCRFGQWYASPVAEFLQLNPAFIALGDAHRKMHDSARTLLKLVVDGLPIPVSVWDRFDNHLEHMRLEFRELRREFATSAQNQDPLTEAQTRASLIPELSKQLALVKRDRQVCTIAMLDLDHFKKVNDEYGHGAGDQVLVSTVNCIKALLRPYDRIYRYGGEEFLICMPDTSLEQAQEIANRIRLAIKQQKIQLEIPNKLIQVSASIGLANLSAARSVGESIDQADKTMYQAKAKGRNCVVAELIKPVGSH